ncbi:hypothetical protein SAMN05216378_5412 [Paenibacillus catalpae]|uniref:Uncharacterized protein n=1 Tax=Paenibacillus catalpae TaxID=1045775 RepID=A0A1I2GTK1_9BACL|nr:hypothetical protein SAMN05216378_5412 [Paenibacillus catalpae]
MFRGRSFSFHIGMTLLLVCAVWLILLRRESFTGVAVSNVTVSWRYFVHQQRTKCWDDGYDQASGLDGCTRRHSFKNPLAVHWLTNDCPGD